jgi:hypothetical protein
MIAAKFELKSPFFKGGFLFCGVLTPFGKEGQGRFFGRNARELCCELPGQDTTRLMLYSGLDIQGLSVEYIEGFRLIRQQVDHAVD